MELSKEPSTVNELPALNPIYFESKSCGKVSHQIDKEKLYKFNHSAHPFVERTSQVLLITLNFSTNQKHFGFFIYSSKKKTERTFPLLYQIIKFHEK